MKPQSSPLQLSSKQSSKMKEFTKLFSTMFCSLCLFYAGQSSALDRMDSQEFDEFYLGSEFTSPPSREIYIMDTEVSFSVPWMLEFKGQTTRNYRRIIKKNYSKALKKQFKRALEERGLKVVNKPNVNSLVLKTHMHDLNILAPEQTPGKVAIVLKNVGNAAITVELSSSEGHDLMKMVDYEDTPDIVGSPLANRSYNFVYFKKLMTNWADMSSGYILALVEQVEKHHQEKQ